MVIRKSLHGLKFSRAAFRALLAERLHALRILPSKEDPYVWMKPGVKPDGFECWEHILYYVDYAMFVLHDPTKSLKALQEFFRLKNEKIEWPDMCLGAEISKM